MKFEYDLIKAFETSFRDNFDLPALSDYDSDRPVMTYGDMASRIASLHILYHELGIHPGDKIAIAGKNSAEWILAFMSVLTYGAVAVPVLHEFSPDDMTTIINHSDSSIFFVSDSIASGLDFAKLPELKVMISLDGNLRVISERDKEFKGVLPSQLITTLGQRLSQSLGGRAFIATDISYKSRPMDDTAIINYTSGTSGFSKGVCLSIANLAGNIWFGADSHLYFSGARCLSFLPLAHAYGAAFDMLVPLVCGAHVTTLGRTPTPRTLVKAFAEVRPNLILCVPLILEKIYKKLIVPRLSKLSVRAALKIPGVDRLVYRQVRQTLTRAFGGAFEQVIVGGAPINPDVESFLKKIGFRFTVGYGMTECGPLISYTYWRKYKLFSAGHILPDLMAVKILEDGSTTDDGHPTGEILVRGINVMQGYYKRPDLNELALSEDGWLHTGDMGYLGEDGGTIYIKGRYKTMILGPSGQNIYPETIENRLNVHPYVLECIVLDRGGRITALIYPDSDSLDADGIRECDRKKAIEAAVKVINSTLAPFERVAKVEIMDEPFEKTPKKSIKRYLYK